MQGFWIETEYFAAPIGDLTPDQHAFFVKSCVSIANGNNKRSEWTHHEIILQDYTQQWESMKLNPRREIRHFFEDVGREEKRVEEQCFGAYTFVKIFPEDVIKHHLEDLSGFSTKNIRFKKIKNQSCPVFRSDSEARDWKLLNEFLDLSENARTYGEERTHEKQPATESVTADSRQLIDTVNTKSEDHLESSMESEKVDLTDAPEKPKKKRRSTAARRGVEEEAIDYHLQHPNTNLVVRQC